MRAASIFVAGAATGSVATAVMLAYAPPGAQLEASPIVQRSPIIQPSPIAQPKSSDRPEAARHRAAHETADPPIAAAIPNADPQPDAAWTALVDGMLEQEVERRFGEKLHPQAKSRLLAELARLREASLSLQSAPPEPRDPQQLRERLAHQVALLEVDRAFRQELGLGVAEFLQGLDVGAVDDVSRSPPPR